MSKKVLYILGAGRSGTTILSVLLGNDPNFFLAGELNRFLMHGGIPPKRSEDDEVTLFWRKIKEEVSVKNYPRLFKIAQSYEYHSGFFKKDVPSAKRKKYRRFINQLIETLYRNIEESILIDSSKYPLRAYHLLQATDHIGYCLYVKRHPVSIVRSCAKKELEQTYMPWYMTNVYLIIINLYCILIRRMMKKRGIRFMEVRYHEFTKEPLTFIKQLSEKFQLNLEYLLKNINQDIPLRTGYQFDGNRIRLKKEIRIKHEEAPKNWTYGEKIVYFCNRFWWK